MYRTKRTDDPALPSDGQRFLVEARWPSGVRPGGLDLAGWPKEVAPSAALQRWFDREGHAFREFRLRYRHELLGHRTSLETMVRAGSRGTVTLVHDSVDPIHAPVGVLCELLEELSPSHAAHRRSEPAPTPRARGRARKARARH